MQRLPHITHKGSIYPQGEGQAMTSYSPFTISASEASQMIRRQRLSSDDNRHCYMLQVTLAPVYGGGLLPQATYKKLPRLINRIPMGAGKLSNAQVQAIQWRYLEGSRDIYTFVSSPMCRDDAEEATTAFRDALHLQARAVFGDVTVKAGVILTQCVGFNSDMIINDIADLSPEGLHFHD